MKTINQIREEGIECNRAFSKVLSLRDKLSDARNLLAAIEADLAARPRQPTTTRDRFRDHVADLTKQLAEAESYCQEINPDKLREHDDKIASAAKAAEVARLAQEAINEVARREAQAKTDAAVEARMEARKCRELEAIESD